MSAHGFRLFDTAIGRCGIAWGPRGIVALQLPEASESATRSRILEHSPEAKELPPPPEVRHALEAVAALLRGEPAELSRVPVDMVGLPPFHRRVYEAARTIPPGETLSYGDLALRLGTPGAARAVGQALRRNPFAILVPCHRVLAANGRIGGFSANGGVATKLRLLAVERTRRDGAAPFASAFGFDPDAALRHLHRADPVLGRLIDAVGPFQMRLKPAASIFTALAEAIVYQQLTGKVAATIFARLCALFPRPHEGLDAGRIRRAPDARLRAAGLSRAKLLALKDLARKTVAGEIPSSDEIRRMDDEAIIERLTEVHGVGRWTVQMLLMFRLGRPDVLPVADYAIRKGFASAFGRRALPSPRALEKHGRRWAPYRTVASWYLWRAAERAAR
jgi:O-6-methylguanine DNA methyltransferase